jgi:hypothetical protein
MTMNKDQIVSAVRESARIDTPEHAEMAGRATLRVLGQRLAGEASDLAARCLLNWGAELLASEGPPTVRQSRVLPPRGCRRGQRVQQTGGTSACSGDDCRPSRGGWRGVPACFGPAAGRVLPPDAHRKRPALESLERSARYVCRAMLWRP